MEIYDSIGTRIVRYKYDAWGVCSVDTGLTTNTTIANLNCIRYRGYYLDTETGLYYLQSRYYDPVVERLLNADTLLGANGDLLSYNLFAYCSNNPVNFSDPTGESITLTALFIAGLIGAAIAGTFNAISQTR